MRHHRVGLARELNAEGLSDARCAAFLDAIEAHARGAQMPEGATDREAALLGYAVALTRAPGAMTAAALEPLRQAGLDDTQILEANQVVAYFAYVNRVVDGLGVELEPFHR